MQDMEFQCPNCMSSSIVFERILSVITEIFDIKKDGGHIVSYQLDKNLHGTSVKKVKAMCSKCGHTFGSFESIELILKHLLDHDYLIIVNEE